jgi:translation elongation factor aEF-1 beta
VAKVYLNKGQPRFNARSARPLLVDVKAAENRASPISAPNVNFQDLRREQNMGEVIALIRLMPEEVLTDTQMNAIIDQIKHLIKAPVRLGRIETKNIAFGLKGLDVTVAVPDEEGGLDPVVETLSSIKNVDNVEVVDVGRI